ncbi:uncharacterized protein LOC125906049 isoform X10 [Epinephelus fuscoguttatus]|uniref:uncharacterized protein LOC125906049 isoform X8 n=1 Tax=Epinephelus fuscoguttatus TaxID=293821 RepID=UPI0020D1D225|nr:uncharacterized protein LOC125906049 isoform X8 [Epinephelus fuscoguttatus]XP_049460399.1 uncharacterized protein LOC125906049 isoform X10 [Epinephelus fuscoguttatus]
MATKISSKYDHITCEVLIRPGSPNVYQLKPKKENIGTLTRKTLSEKDPSKLKKTILLVGETGAGKSALINALVNYTMGVKWKDDVWFQIIEDEKKSQSESQTTDVTDFEGEEKSQCESQTTDVIVFEIVGFEDQTLPYSLTIIDTPGYGDTRGTEHDVIISQRLLDLFRSDDGVYEVSVVGLVMKALKHAWSLTENQMDQFTDFLQNTSSQNLTTTVEVLNTRIRLTGCIHNLQERIEFIEQKQSEIQQNQEALKKYEQEMKNNEEFTVEVDEVYKVKQRVSEWRVLALGRNYGGAVCCTVCKENCHYPCTLALYPDTCKVMKEKCTLCKGKCSVSDHEKKLYCTVCTGKCPASVHVKDKQCTVCEDKCCVSEHEEGKQCPVCKGEKKESDHVKTRWKYVSKTRTVQKTKQDMKEKYEKGKAGCEESTSLLETLQKNIEELEKEKDQWLEEALQHVVTLKQLALKVNSLSTLVYLDFLIEMMKEKGDTEKVTRLEKMKDEMDKNEGIIAALLYRFGRVTAAGRAAGRAIKAAVTYVVDSGGSAV